MSLPAAQSFRGPGLKSRVDPPRPFIQWKSSNCAAAFRAFCLSSFYPDLEEVPFDERIAAVLLTAVFTTARDCRRPAPIPLDLDGMATGNGLEVINRI